MYSFSQNLGNTLYLNRKITADLKKWKLSTKRKPLILQGARQVGKTSLLKSFGKNHFTKFHYINFEADKSVHSIFEKDLIPKRIIDELSIYLDTPITPSKEFIIFDEIQECPNALTSLKYFQEEMPESYICSAGSLLGVYLSSSFPVGKVHFLNLYPLSFLEFLEALDKKMLLKPLDDVTNISEVAHKKLWDNLKLYLITGGMPEVVKIYLEHKEKSLQEAYTKIRETQQDLIKSYIVDIAKYSGKINSLHIERTLTSAAIQLGQTVDGSSQKFKFKGVIPGYAGYKDLARYSKGNTIFAPICGKKYF